MTLSVLLKFKVNKNIYFSFADFVVSYLYLGNAFE